MLQKKCAVYRSTKNGIQNIQGNNRVLLYIDKKGIIARRITSGQLFMKEDKEESEY
ncbi:hypothetical protein [Bacillus toyonensis]|uniref:hypothetical protein n=1 Tax=Bacillus toyonensis TaxID=155322 RepID=UPI00159B903F|nr:hypothetical protein [Bacillus toyonensis]